MVIGNIISNINLIVAAIYSQLTDTHSSPFSVHMPSLSPIHALFKQILRSPVGDAPLCRRCNT